MGKLNAGLTEYKTSVAELLNCILFRYLLLSSGFNDEECERQKNIMVARLGDLEEQAYRCVGHQFSLTSTEDLSQVKQIPCCN